MAGRLVFHIGLEKTGTTSFQQFCYDHSDVLEEYGVFYPKLECLLYGNNHSILSASYLSPELWDYIGSDCQISREVSVKNLIKLINSKSNNESIIISSEHFSSRFSEIEIKQLAKDFYHCFPTIMVFIRDHYSVVRAAYSTWVLSGSRGTIDDFISMLWDPNLLKPQSPDVFYRYCRFEKMIEPWERVFGKDRVLIKAYDDANSSINVMISEISNNKIDLSVSSHYRLNRTLEPYIICYLRQFNMLIPNWDELFSIGKTELWQRICQIRNQFLLLISEAPILKTSESMFTISPESNDRLSQLAYADQVWLGQRGIDFSSKFSHNILIGASSSAINDFDVIEFLNIEKMRGDIRAAAVLDSINELSKYRHQPATNKTQQAEQQSRPDTGRVSWSRLPGIIHSIICSLVRGGGHMRPTASSGRSRVRLAQGGDTNGPRQ